VERAVDDAVDRGGGGGVMGIAEEHEEGVTRPTPSSLRLVEDDHGESMTMITERA
jgi:hypothetical protein